MCSKCSECCQGSRHSVDASPTPGSDSDASGNDSWFLTEGNSRPPISPFFIFLFSIFVSISLSLSALASPIAELSVTISISSCINVIGSAMWALVINSWYGCVIFFTLVAIGLIWLLQYVRWELIWCDLDVLLCITFVSIAITDCQCAIMTAISIRF